MGENKLKIEQIYSDDQRKALKLILKLYDFSLSVEQLEAMLVKEQEVDELTKSMAFIQVRKLISNNRGTLKIVIWKHGAYTILGKQSTLGGGRHFSMAWDTKADEVFDRIQENSWVCVTTGYSGTLEIECLLGTTSAIEKDKWKACLTDIEQIDHNSDGYREIGAIMRIESKGLVSQTILEAKLKQYQDTLAKVQILEAQEEVRKKQALATISVATKNDKTTVSFKGLDDHRYSIETPIHKWNLDTLEDFVYRHRYRWGTYEESHVKAATLFHDIMRIVETLQESWIKLSIDGKAPAEIAYKKTLGSNPVLITYLNNKRVAHSDLNITLNNYFYKGMPLVQPPEAPEVTEAQISTLASRRLERESELTTGGIRGYITDLEGECPINIGFEKKGSRWNLIIGSKNIYLKGGVGMIKSLERVLKGSAQGYDSRHSTEELYARLCKVLPEQDALDIITEAKEMGKLLKALETKKKEG